MGRLLVVTGPSHAGKSALARALLRVLGEPAAHVEIDRIVGTLELAREEPWEFALPIAYDVALADAKVLLDHGVVVVFDSTFTYIPVDGRAPSFHDDQLRRLAQLAGQTEARFAVIRVSSSLTQILHRHELTERLPLSTIKGIWTLHQRSDLGVSPTLTVSVEDTKPADMDAYFAELARRLAADLMAND